MYYFDSAYVAKCYLNDPDSQRVRDLVKEPVELVSSAICIAEVSCAIHRRVREKAITRRQGEDLCESFRQHVRDGIWSLVPLSERLLWAVAQAMQRLPQNVYVRAGDAIHLVSARERGLVEIWSNDRHLILAAEHFGLKGCTV
jgi:predicted nucleic acid-binding protein